MASPACPICGASIDKTTRRCDEGHDITSEHLLGVASTIGNSAHEVTSREVPMGEGQADSLIGKKFGKYAVAELIGRGGMGAVYKAQHEELGHFAAIKVIGARLSGAQDVITRLFREARAAAQIGHANIVQVHDFGRDPEVGGYIVMEYLQGSPLEDVLAAERRFSESRVRAIALEVCDALAAAHAKGIIHRDLKPANVFLQKTARGELAKVMDFGIAKVAESLGESATQPGTVLGTPRYMSPEQWCSEPVDARSDIYSLGVMLYRMTTGALPHPKATSLPQLARVVTQKIEPRPRAVHPGISEGIEKIILKCCEPDPAARFATMSEVAEALRALPSDDRAGGSLRGRLAKRPRNIGRTVAIAMVTFAFGGAVAVFGKGSMEGTRTASPNAPSAVRVESTEKPAAPAQSSADDVVAKNAAPAASSSPALPPPSVDAGAVPVSKRPSVSTTSTPPKAAPVTSGKKPHDLLFGD
jgi:serine/threonine-protein kinase